MVKKLQEELIANISLIPIDASKASGKRAFEIINQLKDNINDIITSGNIWGTALDYVIIADSQGVNTSNQTRVNNRTLLELEKAITDIGGKTSEKLQEELKKLQEELVEKIFLIPIESDEVSCTANGERVLEIINQLKDNINDIIISGNIWGTALDYVIIADSLGDPSAKERTNNCTLKNLEEAIKKIGGKTLEELEPTQRNGRYDRELMLSSMRGHIDNITAVVVREMLDTMTPLHYYAIYANIAQFLGERQIVSRVAGEDNHIHNHNNTEIEVTRATLDSPSMDVESVIVQQHIRGRQSTPSSPG